MVDFTTSRVFLRIFTFVFMLILGYVKEVLPLEPPAVARNKKKYMMFKNRPLFYNGHFFAQNYQFQHF